jgi:transaldolase/glucose-6-phosphate isomerase
LGLRSEAGREDLKGRLGIANAKLAYQQYKALFGGERWDDLAARGATAIADPVESYAAGKLGE